MLTLLPATLAGAALGASNLLSGNRRPISKVVALARARAPRGKDRAERLRAELGANLATADDRFQRFVQAHVDPMLGRAEHSELQTMLGGEANRLTPAEKYANRRLGLGMAALGLSVLGTWVSPLTPVAIVVGVSASSQKYPYAYRRWKETGKIGAIHLMCVYSLFLWFGGYATIGALGAVLYGVMLKAKAVGENESRNNLVSLFQLQPDKVWILVGGVEAEIPFSQLKTGDVLVLRAGQTVPVDGTVVSGVASVDQQALTGESQPVERKAGDAVLAATLVISGEVAVAVEKTSKETVAGQIAEVLNRTIQDTKPVSISAAETADKFALPTLALSAAAFPILGPSCAVSLMGANTTTASYLSGSVSMLNFINLAARSHVLAKDAHALEQLGKVRTVVFDKTGTLTMEQPHVAEVHALGGMSGDEVLALAAAAETRQTHPIARAILDEAAARELGLPAIDEAQYELGYGIKVRLAAPEDSGPGPVVRVGSDRFMRMEGIEIPDAIRPVTAACQELGHSLVMVAVDGALAGCIELKPTVRPEAHEIVRKLRERGLDLYIISGDQEGPTRKLANDLGMTGYFANTLPGGKADLVEKLQAGGRKVCFVGDGINDSIAMRKAHVSISLMGATTVATDTAQIVLMEGNLNQLANLFDLAEEFQTNLERNIQFTSGTSIAAVSCILLGGFSFAATEVFYSAALFGGLAIAMKPMLDRRKRLESARGRS